MNSTKIRLSEFELSNIISIFENYFSPNDELWIFGSRVDVAAKGGDIDLYIKTKRLDADKINKNKVLYLLDLKSKIGEQKIDIVINNSNYDNSSNLLIYDVAESEGIRLR